MFSRTWALVPGPGWTAPRVAMARAWWRGASPTTRCVPGVWGDNGWVVGWWGGAEGMGSESVQKKESGGSVNDENLW